MKTGKKRGELARTDANRQEERRIGENR